MMLAVACAVACAADPASYDDDRGVEETGCSPADCESGLRIALVTTVFTPGAYTVSSRGDGVEAVCDFVIGGIEDGCDGGPCMLEDECDAVANLSFPPHSVVVQVAPDAPEVVEVVVSRGRNQVFADTFVPSYQTFTPAGPGCDPVCEIAEAQVDIP